MWSLGSDKAFRLLSPAGNISSFEQSTCTVSGPLSTISFYSKCFPSSFVRDGGKGVLLPQADTLLGGVEALGEEEEEELCSCRLTSSREADAF